MLGRLLLAIVLSAATTMPASSETFRVLVFTKTTGFRHDSIPRGIELVRSLGRDNHFAVDSTEDGSRFAPSTLARYRVVVFLNTTGDVLNGKQQAALESYVRGGGGWVGVHSAADTEHDWGFYGTLLGGGAWFLSHPPIQAARIRVERSTHPSTRGYPETFSFTDEWYNFRRNPRGSARVLLTIDEGSYDAGAGAMGGDHPISWFRLVGKGRSWYTTLGHRAETYDDPAFARHLLGGILWAAARSG